MNESAVFAALGDPLQLVEAFGLHQGVLNLGLRQLLLVLRQVWLFIVHLGKLVFEQNQSLLSILQVQIKLFGSKREFF